MRVQIIGVGGIGGLLATYLAAGGLTPDLIARGQTLCALREDGLTLLREGEPNARIRCPAFAALSDAPPPDVSVVAVKAHSLPGLAEELAALAERGALVLFAMNGVPWWIADGVGAAERMDPGGTLRRLPPPAVAWAAVFAGAEAAAPGRILSTTPRTNRVAVGRSDGGTDARLAELAGAMTRGGLPTRISPDIAVEAWAKVLANVSIAPIAALCEATNHQVCADPFLRALARELILEVAEVGRALGIAVEIDIEARLDPARNSAHRPSLLQDFTARRPVELGSIVLASRDIARRLGLPTPRLELLAGLLEAKARHLGLLG